MNLILIGYRGTGKTTVAEHLAQRLNEHQPGWAWLDADVELERRAGQTIAEIFATHGEGHFRDLESQTLAELVARDRHVLALGGGAILRSQNRQAIKSSAAHVVWLTASPETILARIAGDPQTAARRPNLTSRGGLSEVQGLLAERQPFYAECAGQTVDTERKSPAEIADEILVAVPRLD